jgi:BolA protein
MTIQHSIEQKLTALDPVHLEVVNESHMHNVPEGSESHFKVTVVSDQFDGQMLVARHRKVNALLADELAGAVHALALHTRTPDEWFENGSVTQQSPQCMGGSKSEQKE